MESGSTFREIQCNEFNTIPYKGTLYEWEPISTPGSLVVLCSVQLTSEEMYDYLILQSPEYHQQSSSHAIIYGAKPFLNVFSLRVWHPPTPS